MARGSLLSALWDQNRSALVILIFLLAACLLLFIVHDQLLDPKVARLQQKKLDLQQELRERQQQESEAGLPLSAAERIDKDLQRFYQLIPAKQSFSEFIGDLFAAAQQAGLTITAINYQPEPIAEMNLLKYALSFSVSGGYPQLKHFIYQLENSPRILIIDRISLSGSNNAQGSGNSVSLQMELTTLFQEASS